MNAAVFLAVRPNASVDPQSPLPLVADDVQRYVWEGKFASMLIEVVRGRIFVNGEPVEPADPSPIRRVADAG